MSAGLWRDEIPSRVHAQGGQGRQLKRAEEVRWVADYNGESVLQADATGLVDQAHVFVTAMQDLFFAASSTKDVRKQADD